MPSIEYILFDLDGTLYSSRWGLEQAISGRVNDYIAEYLGLPREEAWALRKERIIAGNYGTTLEWLRAEQNMGNEETENYFAFCHPENEADNLPPDPALRTFLLSLSSRGIPFGILTNSIMEHALRILDKLNVSDLFKTIFDMRKNGLAGKPSARVYENVLNELGISAQSCLLIDDVPRYVEGYMKIGGTGVLFDEDNRRPDFPEGSLACSGSADGPGFRVQKLEEILNLRFSDGSLLFP